MDPLEVDELRAIAVQRLAGLPDGEPLQALESALIRLAINASVTCLDRQAIARAVGDCAEAGATPDQMQEMVSLVSGLGIHSLMATSVAIADAAKQAGRPVTSELDARRQELWTRYVGSDSYWDKFEIAVPGFLEALVRNSPDQFEAFFTYCALPWKNPVVRARTKELAALACDATPAHRFLPGFLLHLDNAIAIGVQRSAIMGTLDIAANAPAHVGYR